MRSGFTNGTRLAIIASQIPFGLAMINEGGWWSIAGYAVLVTYLILTTAIVAVMVVDRRSKNLI